jgi:hypothetical protein
MFSIKSLKFSKAPCSTIPLLSRHCWIKYTAFRSLESRSAAFSQWHDLGLTCSFWHVLVLPLAIGMSVRKPQRGWSLEFLPNGHIRCQMILQERELDRLFKFDGPVSHKPVAMPSVKRYKNIMLRVLSMCESAWYPMCRFSTLSGNLVCSFEATKG